MTDSTLQQTQLSELGVTAPETDTSATLAPTVPTVPTDAAIAVTDPGHRPQSRRRRNVLTHALRSTIGSLPVGCGYINRLSYQVRRQLEQAVASTHGSISVTMAAWIDSAVKWGAARPLGEQMATPRIRFDGPGKAA